MENDTARTFAELLDHHLARGTRPDGSIESLGRRWSNIEFGDLLETNERSVRNWRTGRSIPVELARIEETLFGDERTYDPWRLRLREAYDKARRLPGPKVQRHSTAHNQSFDEVKADTLLEAGYKASIRSDYTSARVAYEQALQLFRQVDDKVGEASSIRNLGAIALAQADYMRAQSAFQDALQLYRQMGHIVGQANSIGNLGSIALKCADYISAQAAYEQALQLYRQVGDVLGEAYSVANLGGIALMRSEHACAQKAYEQSRQLYRQIGDIVGEANSVRNLGYIALARADYVSAQAAYEEARQLYRQAGDVSGEALCQTGVERITSENDRRNASTDRSGP